MPGFQEFGVTLFLCSPQRAPRAAQPHRLCPLDTLNMCPLILGWEQRLCRYKSPLPTPAGSREYENLLGYRPMKLFLQLRGPVGNKVAQYLTHKQEHIPNVRFIIAGSIQERHNVKRREKIVKHLWPHLKVQLSGNFLESKGWANYAMLTKCGLLYGA